MRGDAQLQLVYVFSGNETHVNVGRQKLHVESSVPRVETTDYGNT